MVPGYEDFDDHLLLLKHLVMALSDALLGILGLEVLDVPIAEGITFLVGLQAGRLDITELLKANLKLLGGD